LGFHHWHIYLFLDAVLFVGAVGLLVSFLSEIAAADDVNLSRDAASFTPKTDCHSWSLMEGRRSL
jgi:hypothetical protein